MIDALSILFVLCIGGVSYLCYIIYEQVWNTLGEKHEPKES